MAIKTINEVVTSNPKMSVEIVDALLQINCTAGVELPLDTPGGTISDRLTMLHVQRFGIDGEPIYRIFGIRLVEDKLQVNLGANNWVDLKPHQSVFTYCHGI